MTKQSNKKSEMSLMKALFRANLMNLTSHQSDVDEDTMRKLIAESAKVGTFVRNMSFFGYVPNMDVAQAVYLTPDEELADFWEKFKNVLGVETAYSLNMERFMVYKNFPKEVLKMDEATYWIKQMFIYMGVPAHVLAETPEPREKMNDKIQYKVLGLAKDDSLQKISQNLKASKSRWTDKQLEDAIALQKHFNDYVSVHEFQFKENFLNLALLEKDYTKIVISNATDAVRLAYAWVLQKKGEDVENLVLNKKTQFKGLSRPQRRFILSIMDESRSLEEDVAARQDVFKQFFYSVHPGDYNVPNVQKVYDGLYNKKLKSFNAKLTNSFVEKNEQNVIELLKSNPGVFVRNLMHAYKKFDMSEAVAHAFMDVVPQLSTLQLVNVNALLKNINVRKNAIYPPRGNWSKAHFVVNNKVIKENHLKRLVASIDVEITKRLNKVFPEGLAVDERLSKVKLPSNDQKLATYGRGTRFEIPENVKFVRTSSYWKTQGGSFFDNGWNFFDSQWQSKGTICWNSTHGVNGAIFSGDAVNTADMAGRACQVIDLDLAELRKNGVRYAVWNILCYSKISFAKADEVMGTLQFVENSVTGKVFEPSRAQFVFPLKDNVLTKYVAMIDLETNEVIYWDANLKGQVGSASSNQENGSMFSAYQEYVDAQPSLLDLFGNAKPGTTKILFSDEKVSLKDDEKAYVFKPLNPENKFIQLDLGVVLK